MVPGSHVLKCIIYLFGVWGVLFSTLQKFWHQDTVCVTGSTDWHITCVCVTLACVMQGVTWLVLHHLCVKNVLLYLPQYMGACASHWCIGALPLCHIPRNVTLRGGITWLTCHRPCVYVNVCMCFGRKSCRCMFMCYRLPNCSSVLWGLVVSADVQVVSISYVEIYWWLRC